MPIDRGPSNPFFTAELSKGRLIRLRRQEGEGSRADDNLALTFQYNPETVTFSRSGRWEPRKRKRDPDAAPTAQQTHGQFGGHGASALLSGSESISFTLIFDATETILREQANGRQPDPALGVLPELSFLQRVSIGREVEDQLNNKPKGTEIRPIRPDELLLQLGASRWYPCVMTELRITEQRHSPQLVPIRAECSLTLNVLEPVEAAYSPLTRLAFQHLLDQRVAQSTSLGSQSSSTLEAALKSRGTR